MSSAGHIFDMIRRIRANKIEKKRFGKFKSQKKWDNIGTVKDHKLFEDRVKDESYKINVRTKLNRQNKEELVKTLLTIVVFILIFYLIIQKVFS